LRIPPILIILGGLAGSDEAADHMEAFCAVGEE